MKHYSFPKIRQYHQVIRDLKLRLSYQGKDENGDPIYKEPESYPTIKFIGRVKLHGSWGGIVFSPDGSFYCESRENIVDEVKDNAGFAHWVNKEGKDIRHSLFSYFAQEEPVKHLVLCGEWCCGSVQNGVALNQLSKRFVVFGLKVIFEDDSTQWLDSSGIKNESINVYNIADAPQYEIEVDLNRPDKAIEQMVKWVEEIDKVCPFGKMFDVEGHGEGLVFSEAGKFGFDMAYKVKGESHQKSKIKKLPTVDVQRLDSIQECVDTYCHEDRMIQIFDKVVKREEDKVPQNIASFIKNLVEDCWTEEGDSILASDISRKEFGAAVSKKAAKWFQNEISKL